MYGLPTGYYLINLKIIILQTNLSYYYTLNDVGIYVSPILNVPPNISARQT